MGILDGFYGLGAKINKVTGSEKLDQEQGVVSPLVPELELSLSDEELIKLTESWEREWNGSPVRSEWLQKCEENEKYWEGKQFGKAEAEVMRPLVDNVIFESVETFLPQATRRNPEPIVKPKGKFDNDAPALKFAEKVQKDLADLADTMKLRLKVKRVARHWTMYLIGVGRVGWNTITNQPTLKIVRGKKLILDPKATIDEDGYNGKYIGEFRKMEASILVKIAPGHKEFITELVKGEMGTDVQFIDWSTAEYTCWTLKGKVLFKKKNIHWNYDETQNEKQVDEYGAESMVPREIKGINHFKEPKIPYIFLSIFNLGKQPIDETSLISQSLSSQDLINKRLKQIDRNADSMNNGMVVSEGRSGLTKEQAANVTEALRRGGTVVIPDGNVNDAVARMSANALPSDVFQQLADTRNRQKERFGIAGLTPSGIQSDNTVRGKILTRSVDTDRIGGGITEYLEQFADDVYNWFVQLYYVYDEEYRDLVQLGAPELVVSVKEGSMLPKDSVFMANQAIELARAGKMSLIDLYKALDDPDPEEKAVNVWLENNAPQILYAQDPRVQQAMGMMAVQAQAQQAMAQSDKGSKRHDPTQEGDILDQVPIE